MSDTKVRTRKGGEITLTENAIQKFRESLRGELIQRAHPGYNDARKVYNAMHDRHPSLLIWAVGVPDVIAVIKFARDHDLLLAVRGGGHNVAGFGTCDGGVVLDLRRMKGIRVDPERRTVHAEGGCTWGDLNDATHAIGMATTGGIVSSTGIGGLTLGGGLGYLERKCGLSCDNLLSADIVMADGGFLTCSQDRETDLFWAIRGGGGNFGVVTSFEFRLHPVKEIFGGPIFFPLDGDVVRAYRDFILMAPEELGAIFAFTMAPPLPFVPAEWHGKPVCALVACWAGPVEDGEKILAPLKDWGLIVGSFFARMPYPAINKLFDELLPPGLQNYWKSNYMRELSDKAIEAHLKHGARVPCIQSGTFLYPIDGACQRVPREATAFAYRDTNFSTIFGGSWPNPADNDQNIKWVREYYDALRPYAEEGGYVNSMSDSDQDGIRANYGENYKRLVEIKTRYDPTNIFQMNQNIKPIS